MENLISLVSKLERVCTAVADHGQECPLPTDRDELPSIAVVGDQCSGKSSVLENIVGKDLLPRGSGIVTRCPLVLQLHRIDGREYVEFLHKPKKRFTDFAQVRQEILNETDRTIGSSRTISSVPINLKLFSPDVVNMTLIDLPGLTKVAVEGQPDSIVQDIENMVRVFIEKPKCIILAVCPADQDVAMSHTIKICREVDPNGERTFGILTKIDVMDDGSGIVKILEGRVCQFKAPWTGVVNRSQEDIRIGVDMVAARIRECNYFANTPEYKHLAHRMGSENLVRLISKSLELTIKPTISATDLFTNCSINTKVPQKNRLQTFTLRAYGTLPVYQLSSQGKPHSMTFGCTVQVQGRKFESAMCHQLRKNAEEDAASVACSELMGNETLETLRQLIKLDSVCKIMLLKEYSLKKKIVEPVYGSSIVAVESQRTLWLSTVTLGSRTFFGDGERTKRCSAQNAASAAAIYLLEEGDEVMVKELRARRLKVTASRDKSNSDADGGSKEVRKKRKLIAADLQANS